MNTDLVSGDCKSQEYPQPESQAARTGGRPLFSILMPTKDRPQYFQLAMESVLGQLEAASVEILVWDVSTGSATEQFVSGISDPRVKYFRRPAQGMVNDWRGLLGYATGDYICFLHDDDVWENDFLASMTCLIDAYPGVAMVSAAFRTMDASGQFLGSQQGVKGGITFLPDARVTAIDNALPIFSTAIRRDLIELQDFALMSGICIDYYLMVKASGRGKTVVLTPQHLMRYRQHSASTTASGRLKFHRAERWIFRTLALQSQFAEQRALCRDRLATRYRSDGKVLLRARRYYRASVLLRAEWELRKSLKGAITVMAGYGALALSKMGFGQ